MVATRQQREDRAFIVGWIIGVALLVTFWGGVALLVTFWGGVAYVALHSIGKLW